MHAGMVNAGGFLLNRLAPLYGLSSISLHVVFLVGGLTVLLGATMMLTQNDIKKTLGFSTMGQMGYMTMECGLGAFALAIFHLIAHGVFKATLFLSAGQVIHAARREPKLPPSFMTEETPPFSRLTWFTGFAMTLIVPLTILLAAHDLLNVPLRDQQGAVIFLFFGWVTASQAILSLYRLNAVASWKVALTMVLTLLLIGFTYLWAGELFTYFLYPKPGTVAQYFQVAALPGILFDGLVLVTTFLIVLVWILLYANAQGKHFLVPEWVTSRVPRWHVWFMNRLYIDVLYEKLGHQVLRLAHRLDKTL
jgi:NADH-quinone oxidoreductase subunit L